MIAGLLLTGGSSRRMGTDKADLWRGGERLVDRAARVLTAVCEPVLEVGPGRSSLPAVREVPPGAGPLVALVAGAAALRARDAHGPLLLLAVDLPFVEASLLHWLADRPGNGTVVPQAGGRPQLCCARYGPDALAAAAELTGRGERSLRGLLASTPFEIVTEAEWCTVAASNALDDVDTPEDAARFGLRARDR